MACTLSNTGIGVGCVILSQQVSQSIDAFTGEEAYDINVSGSLVVTGSIIMSSSAGFIQVPGILESNQDNVLVYQTSTGNIFYTSSDSFVVSAGTGPYLTGSNCDIKSRYGDNCISSNRLSVIGGGCDNKIYNGEFSGISSGYFNQITSSCQATSNFIGGGKSNCMSNRQVYYNAIVGGENNAICGDTDPSSTSANNTRYNFIGGGNYNIISGSNTMNVIVGGQFNRIISEGSNPGWSFIGGGYQNKILSDDIISFNSIVGGCFNTISSSASITNTSIVGGAQNTSSACLTFIAGYKNHAKHCESSIIGSCITSCAVCTTHVNNLHAGCTVQLQPRDPIGSGQVGMLIACDLGGGRADLYFHNGTAYKKVCLVP